VVREGVLTTDKVAGCPQLKIPAEVVFYEAWTGYTGPDHVAYQVTDEKGEVASYDVTITAKQGSASSTPSEPSQPGGARGKQAHSTSTSRTEQTQRARIGVAVMEEARLLAGRGWRSRRRELEEY
jgi:hypothetical protein